MTEQGNGQKWSGTWYSRQQPDLARRLEPIGEASGIKPSPAVKEWSA
jgi:hypothetical protein